MTRTFAARALPALAACALWPAAALAQLPDTFQLERLRISPDAASLSSVEGGEVQPDLTWSAGMWTGWSQNPLVAYRLQDGARAPLVANRVGGSVFGAFGFGGWAQLSVELPVVLFQDRQLSSIFPASELSSLSAAGVGTLRVTPKVQLLSARDRGVDLALQAAFGIPLSSGASYTGEPGLAFSPGVAISRTLGDFRLAGGVGATLRQNTTLLNAEIGPELEAQAGAGWQPSLPSGQQLPLSVELAVFAGTSATRPFAQTNETPVELRGLLTYQPISHVHVFLGGGRGLQRGWGTPAWRAFGGVRVEGSLLPLLAPRPAPRPAPAIAAVVPPPPPPAPGPAPAPAPEVHVAGNQIAFEGTVHFETGSAEISDVSSNLIGSLASFLIAHPELEKIRVEGHTDDVGGSGYNKDLSNRRARAVVAALVARGVAPERLTSQGFGSSRPLKRERTPFARARNRRVELHVVSSSATPSPAHSP